MNLNKCDKVILVTGASRGIGRQAAIWAGRAGAKVAACARSYPELEQLVAELPGTETFIRAIDIASPADTQLFVNQAAEQFGRLDVLINNAGCLGPAHRLADTDLNDWVKAVDVNVIGCASAAQAAIPWLRQTKGTIVQVVSGAGAQPIPSFSSYCITKAAVIMLARVIAAEEPSITSLCYSPGETNTDMQKHIRAADIPEPWRSYFSQAYNQNRLISPETAGRTLAWLGLTANSELSGKTAYAENEDLNRQAEAWFAARLPESQTAALPDC